MTTPEREDDVLGTIDDYVHGLLSPADRAYAERRIAESRVWAAAHDEARRRLALLEAAPVSEPDETLIRATLDRVRVEGPRRQRRRRVITWGSAGAIAALVLAFLGAELHFAALSPSPYDLEVLGQDTLLSGSHASLRVRLSRPDSHAGVGGADVEITLRDRESGEVAHLASFVTDSAGTGSPRLALPEWDDGRYELTVSAATPGGLEEITRTVELRHEWRVLLSTDKPVYQPGQVIHLRAFVLRSSTGRPAGGEAVVFEVSDPKGNLIERERTVTSEFGIASADCALADLLNEGTYSVRCRVGQTEGERSVEVMRYVPPKFGVRLRLDQPFYQPGSVIEGSIDAAYFFGKPVAGGDVDVTLADLALGSAPPTAGAHLELDAGGRGVFRIRLPDRLLGTATDDGDAAIEVAVAVRDTAGQEVRKTLRTVVTTRPLRLTLVPESGRLVPGVENEVFVFVTAADGRPVDARVSVEGLRADLRTGPLGVASFTLRPQGDAGEVTLSARATDDLGRAAADTFVLATDRGSDAFVLRTDAAAYDAGDIVHLSVFGGGSAPVFIDLVRDGQTVLTDRIMIENGRGTHDMDLPAELTGTLRLVAYRFDGRGRPVRCERVVVVRPARELNVEIDGADGPHRPGETARLTFTVTGAGGRPAPGALSLAVVDEAVFGVRAPGASLDGRLDAVEQELLEPIYAVYPWDPFATSTGDAGARVQRAVGALSARQQPSARDELLRRLVEENYFSEDMLDVLESERLDELLGTVGDRLSADTQALLRGDTGLYTLQDTSYPQKALAVERSKRAWHRARAWIAGALGALVALALLAAILAAIARATGGPALGCVLVGALATVGLIVVLMPAVGKARDQARILKDTMELLVLGESIEMAKADAPPPPPPPPEGASIRVRDWFPETLLWRPQLVTDDAGVVTLDVPLADSITSWKIAGAAITTSGRLGTVDADLVVFQPFFVDVDAPVALVRGDEIELPIVVSNYLDREQTVRLRVEPAEWFDLRDEPEKTLRLAGGAVTRTAFRIRALALGGGRFEVRAVGTSADGRQVGDAVRRTIAVDPEGEAVDRVVNGVLRRPAELDVRFPAEAVEGSERVVLKLYPSSFSQVLEGLDGIFQRPYGCFEQTSSTTYPNLLALEYLRRTGVSAPEVESRALAYVHLGYQRLLSFEVDGGGFDWFGNPPANRMLTAYGLMEFEDMARVRDVDEHLIDRTRRWLLAQQAPDGSWAPETHEMSGGPAGRDPTGARLATTAYVAWSVFRGEARGSEPARRAARFLKAASPASLDDPYTASLVALALLATEGEGAARPCLDRLLTLREVDRSSDATWWERPLGVRTMFYGAGASADVETTALAALALLESGREPGAVRAALSWLAGRRDALGTWGTTQATVLALKTLVAASEHPVGSDARRVVEVRLDGRPMRRVVIEAEQADVVQVLDLTDALAPSMQGTLAVEDVSDASTAYQLALRHHRAGAGRDARADSPLAIDLTCSTADLRVGDWVRLTATVENRSGETLPMVVLDLPVPAGFAVDRASFDDLLEAGRIARFEVTPRSVIVYLRRIDPRRTLDLEYRLQATMPVEIEAPGATATEYYTPEIRATSPGLRLRSAGPA